MIPYQMTPNLTKAELISAMDSINHSNALYGHSNEDSSKKKNGIFLFFPHRAVIELFILFRQTFKTISKPKILRKRNTYVSSLIKNYNKTKEKNQNIQEVN